MKMEMREYVELPPGVTAAYDDGILVVRGAKGEIKRAMKQPAISISVSEGKVQFHAPKATQREKRHMFTMRAHTRNLVLGVQEGFTYRLKVCSGHFPMNLSISNGVLTVKNFLGESVPRTLRLKQGADVKIDGDIITVTAPDKELAGMQASDIEQLTRITNRDRRIFQDGIYITKKAGKEGAQ